MIKILIIDDHQFTRQTLEYDLKKIPNIRLLGSKASAKEGIEFIQNKENETPDVILMDIAMPEIDGIEATKIIKKVNEQIKIIMLTVHQDKSRVRDALSSGAVGYCVKDIKTSDLVDIIEIVAEGGVWFDKKIASYILDILKNSLPTKETKAATDFGVTPREVEVVELIAKGASNKEITQRLTISMGTAKNHVASILKKLSLNDRTQIAIFALNNNLVESEEDESRVF
ncbi:LuxR family transcriptional regulator [Candidatus Gastranaerophilus sp. (ex Termes propinquus)]|nr:LuxR family transcriptional regulator [Candidatus Gastranaerophilus sp. (ex Termes propinquus)]